VKITKFLNLWKIILIFNILQQKLYWAICHIPRIIGFESGLKKIEEILIWGEVGIEEILIWGEVGIGFFSMSGEAANGEK
jgi:hypothetical protein